LKAAVLDYRRSANVAGAQKSILHLSLIQRWSVQGHQVTAAKTEKDAAKTALWKDSEEIWQEDAAAIASAESIKSDIQLYGHGRL
jgi:hypothetical protein